MVIFWKITTLVCRSQSGESQTSRRRTRVRYLSSFKKKRTPPTSSWTPFVIVFLCFLADSIILHSWLWTSSLQSCMILRKKTLAGFSRWELVRLTGVFGFVQQQQQGLFFDFVFSTFPEIATRCSISLILKSSYLIHFFLCPSSGCLSAESAKWHRCVSV